ncbi:hypothetical protein D3C87_2083580 [compost metagenome]
MARLGPDHVVEAAIQQAVHVAQHQEGQGQPEHQAQGVLKGLAALAREVSPSQLQELHGVSLWVASMR